MDLVPDPYGAEDATDWCGRLLNEEGANVWNNEVEGGLDPSRWAAGDELGENGVGEGCVVSRDEREEQCNGEDERRDVDTCRPVEVLVVPRHGRGRGQGRVGLNLQTGSGFRRNL